MKHRIAIPAVIGALAIALMACPAGATTITSDAGTTPTISASAEGHVVFDNPIAKIECASSFQGGVTSHGPGVTARIDLTALSFTSCTNSWHLTVLTAGSLEIHSSGGGNSTVTWSGTTVETTRFGIVCRYTTNNTDIATLTGGTHATLDLTAAIPFHSGSSLCGTSATTWTGSYKVNSPTNLIVE